MKDRPVYLVEWQDSTINIGWKPEADLDVQMSICWTVGVVVRRDRTMVALAQSYSSHGDVDSVMAIPRGMIRSMRRLL